MLGGREMNKHEINKAGIAFAEKMFESHAFSIDRPPVTKGPVDFIASLNGRTMRIKVRAVSQIGSYVFMEKRRFNICDNDLFMAVAYLPINEDEKILYKVVTFWNSETFYCKGTKVGR